MDPQREAIIEISNLHKRYGKEAAVLQDINITVNRGEFVSVLGPSGCGKSTLLKLIAGLLNYNQGTILVDGKAPNEARDDLGFIFQTPALMPWLTVSKNVQVPLKLKSVDRKQREATSKQLLSLVGLSDAADKFPRQLSGGMQMRVSIARALSVTPSLILMDEPFSTLDEITRNKLNEDLLCIRSSKNWTVLFVTHSVAEAVYLSNKIHLMSSNPGAIGSTIDIDFPYPRTAELRDSIEYQSKVSEVGAKLREINTIVT